MSVRSLGATIRRARLARGWSQARLGHETGMPQSNIARIEKGVDDMRLSTFERVISALGYNMLIAPSLSTLFSDPPRGSRIEAARDYGVDLGQLYASISMTPEERLAAASRNAIGIAELLER
ncbi:MAG: helix-turn-helix transcriptional regulator [Candidatus Baltobacteraceae bacterium]